MVNKSLQYYSRLKMSYDITQQPLSTRLFSHLLWVAINAILDAEILVNIDVFTKKLLLKGWTFTNSINTSIMKQIILPSDFSDNAWKAMSYAADLYHNTPCKFHIINTYSYPAQMAEAGGVHIILPLQKDSEKQLQELLKQFKDLDHHVNSEFETKSISGSLINTIVKIEDSAENNSMIVMGTRGASGIGKLFFGSMTASVIKKCTSPVICVPNHASLDTPKNIMLALDDLLISSQNEIQPLLELAQNWESKIDIVHINESKLRTDKKASEKIVTEQYMKQFEHKYHELFGTDIEDELTYFAKTNEVGLITLIKRNKGFWENLFQTSLSLNMAFYSKIPLLILRES